jgi:hypothetical protein
MDAMADRMQHAVARGRSPKNHGSPTCFDEGGKRIGVGLRRRSELLP